MYAYEEYYENNEKEKAKHKVINDTKQILRMEISVRLDTSTPLPTIHQEKTNRKK
jgi:hypothetical protein